MRWLKRGKIRKHPPAHHAHRSTGTPVYHDLGMPLCWTLALHGITIDPTDDANHVLTGDGEDHHGGLDHNHET